MRTDDVPQDASFYGGHRRACYAVDSEGRYTVAHSAGWSVERAATEQALLDLEDKLESVRRGVVAGRLAPLAYHMGARQMTPTLLASHMGIATWRVKRHLKPRVFARLSPELLERYADCLDLPASDLAGVPDRPTRRFLSESP